MNNHRAPTRPLIVALAAMVLGGVACIIGLVIDERAFFPAWLCAVIFWLALPLGAVTLVMVHDLTGGRWMATARPVLDSAIATMPIATVAFLPVLAGLGHLYSWSQPGAPGLGNAFYLNDTFFIVRYAVYFVVWNASALWALAAPRGGAIGVAPALSWISGIGLLLLAFATTFASFDWIMSLEPQFWSSVFGMIFGAGEFNISLALVLLAIALQKPALRAVQAGYREHLADLAAILLATTIFWAYVEYCQFLIVWEENLRSEIPWYLHRFAGSWEAVLYTVAGAGFFIPFFVLVWTPSKRNRGIVAVSCGLIFLAQLIHVWWLVLPDFPNSGFGWLDVAAFFALGGLVMSAFLWRLRYGQLLPQRAARPAPEALHG